MIVTVGGQSLMMTQLFDIDMLVQTKITITKSIQIVESGTILTGNVQDLIKKTVSILLK